jgi:hypothetical protein
LERRWPHFLGQKVIDSYSFGEIKIQGILYNHDVFVTKDKVEKFWRKTSHKAEITDIEKFLEPSIKTIIFGSGAYGFMDVLPETISFLEKKGIKTIVKDTAKAIKEFNSLSEKEEGIVGFFHLTC